MFTPPKTLLFSQLAFATLFASNQSFAGKAARHFLTEDYRQHNP